MRNHPFTIFAVLLVLLPWTPVAAAQHATGNEQSENPLAPFERLIGGQWHIEGSYQEFEWGLGKQSVAYDPVALAALRALAGVGGGVYVTASPGDGDIALLRPGTPLAPGALDEEQTTQTDRWYEEGPLLLVLLLFGAFLTAYRAARVARRFPAMDLFRNLSQATSQIDVRGAFAIALVFIALAQGLGVEMILGAFLGGAFIGLLAGTELSAILARSNRIAGQKCALAGLDGVVSSARAAGLL